MPLTAHLAGALSITDPVEKAGQTRLLVTAAGLGHVALRALGLENLGACDGLG